MAKKRAQAVVSGPRISVGLPPEHVKRLEQLAREHERSVAWLVRYAVKAFITEIDKGQLSLDLEPSPRER